LVLVLLRVVHGGGGAAAVLLLLLLLVVAAVQTGVCCCRSSLSTLCCSRHFRWAIKLFTLWQGSTGRFFVLFRFALKRVRNVPEIGASVRNDRETICDAGQQQECSTCLPSLSVFLSINSTIMQVFARNIRCSHAVVP
jgi:hypothetical protein